MQAPKRTAPIREALRARTASNLETPSEVILDRPAVDNGRKPLAARFAAAAAIRSRFLELYGIPPTGARPIFPIEAAFKFAPAETDADFNYLHVESLLDEASGLLQRCRQLRAERDALLIDKWNLQLELDRFFRLDALTEAEREAGLDTMPYEAAAWNVAAEAALEANHKNAEAQLKGLTNDLLATGFNRRMAARELTAWVSAYPLKDNDLRGDDAGYTFDGTRKTKPEHLFDAARIEADEAAWEQATDLVARRFVETAASESARLRGELHSREAKLALAGIALRREQAQSARDAAWEKAHQAQAPNGLLNYQERIAATERHFAAEFREALARIAAAHRGLNDLYGYAPAFPAEGAPGYLDDVAAWVARAQGRLQQLAQREQTYLLTLSLKDLTKDRWDAGRSASEWTFDVPEELFKGQSRVRLRGLGAAVLGAVEAPEAPNPKGKAAAKLEAPPIPKPPEGFWSAHITVPAEGAIRLTADKLQPIDQKHVPICCLGRVADAHLAAPAEINGDCILYNASPIGKQWRVALSPKSTGGVATGTLDDVLLHLRIAVAAERA